VHHYLSKEFYVFVGKDGVFDSFVGSLGYMRLTVGPNAAVQDDD
jgi:hypothetical protein